MVLSISAMEGCRWKAFPELISGSGLNLRIGLWLEWYLGLGCGSVYQCNGGVQVESFPRVNFRVRVKFKDMVRVGMVFKVRVWFCLSIRCSVTGRNLSGTLMLININNG